MFVNARFRWNPKAILDAYWDINSSQNAMGTYYTINSMGIGYFELEEYGATTLRLLPGNEIKAYYLASSYGEKKTLLLQDQADYFFTDTITGCQFAAYGNDRQRMTVVHSNYLNAPSANAQSMAYSQDATQVRLGRFDNTAIFGQRNYRKGGFRPGEDASNTVVTVIGWRKDDGWHFYARRRLNEHNNRRALDPAAFELNFDVRW